MSTSLYLYNSVGMKDTVYLKHSDYYLLLASNTDTLIDVRNILRMFVLMKVTMCGK